jgi:hypothetical protein
MLRYDDLPQTQAETVTRILEFLRALKMESRRLSKGFATAATSSDGTPRGRDAGGRTDFGDVKANLRRFGMNFECTEIDLLPSHAWEFSNAHLN